MDFSKLEQMPRDSLARAFRSIPSSVRVAVYERGILAMRDRAVAFNRQTQINVVDAKWRPVAGCE